MKHLFPSICIIGIVSINFLFSDEEQLDATDSKNSSIINNSSFESGDGNQALGWTFAHNQPAVRSDSDSHTGKYSAYINLKNDGEKPSESHIIKSIDGKFLDGFSYELSFFVKQKRSGTGGYIQQYFIEWFNEEKQAREGTGFKDFSSKIGEWDKIIVPDIEIPESARSVKLLFRFVTAAVSGGRGEVFIDDINLRSDNSPQSILSHINLKVDQAQFKSAIELIDVFLKKYPDDLSKQKMLNLKSRLIKFQNLENLND